MRLKELIWLAHGMEMMNVIRALQNAEWSSQEQFMDIVDIETSALYAAILVDNAFAEYSDDEIQQSVMEIIYEYINDKYYEAV